MTAVTSTRARIKLRRILTATDNNVKAAMQDSANILEREMRQRVPKNTRNLAETISSKVSKNGLRAEVGFRGKKGRAKGFYARFIEFGTKGHEVSVDRKKVLSGAGETFGTEADIPAMPARPFIGPTWEARKPEVQSRVAKAIQDAVDKARRL
jgi:HK97 gp10 family phage protein